MAGRSTEKESKWHVEKGVPLALIVVLIIQTVGVSWWASGITQRVNDLERGALAATPRLEEVIKLETKVDGIKDSLTEIKAALAAMAAIPKREPDRR